MQTALITGASRGLGRALTDALSTAGWRVVVDARSAADLHAAATTWSGAVALPGDVTDEQHLCELTAAVGDRLDLLVLNASSLGQTPLPPSPATAVPSCARCWRPTPSRRCGWCSWRCPRCAPPADG